MTHDEILAIDDDDLPRLVAGPVMPNGVRVVVPMVEAYTRFLPDTPEELMLGLYRLALVPGGPLLAYDGTPRFGTVTQTGIQWVAGRPFTISREELEKGYGVRSALVEVREGAGFNLLAGLSNRATWRRRMDEITIGFAHQTWRKLEKCLENLRNRAPDPLEDATEEDT